MYRNAQGETTGGINGANFSLPPGAFFTLLGPSGCGKTTALRSIAGLEDPDRGRILIGDEAWFDSERDVSVPLNRRNIGMVFQSYAIWPHMTVFENVSFPLRISRERKYSRAEIKRMVGEALETVNLGGFESRPATQLSGGQQQRVALARAIVRQPRLLLLDEPLSNLDATLRESMRNELKRLQQQLGVTTVYVTHDQTEALEMSDLIAVLNHGKIVQIGEPRELYHRPADAFVASFVGSTNLMHGVVQDDVSRDGIASVRLADGAALRCTFPNPAAPHQPIAVAVRPESVTISARPANGDRVNRMSGIITMTSFLGGAIRYSVRVGEQVMLAQTASDSALRVGDSVTLQFSIEDSLAVPLGSPQGRAQRQMAG